MESKLKVKRQVFAEVINWLLDTHALPARASHNDFKSVYKETLGDKPHPVFLFQMNETVKGPELSAAAQQKIDYLMTLGIFTEGHVDVKQHEKHHRNEHIVMSLNTDLDGALEQLLQIAQAERDMSGNKTANTAPIDFQKLAEEAGVKVPRSYANVAESEVHTSRHRGMLHSTKMYSSKDGAAKS